MNGRDEDKKMLSSFSKDDLSELIFLHLRDLWAVDGLYFLGIEERYGTQAATEIDRGVWEVMGKIEAKRLRKFMDVEEFDIQNFIKALKLSGWSLDIEEKEIIVRKDKVIFRNVNCRTQRKRIEKGLGEFPCKSVRWGFLKSFAYELNPNIEVKCNLCPPDKHPDDLWCEWEFVLKSK